MAIRTKDGSLRKPWVDKVKRRWQKATRKVEGLTDSDVSAISFYRTSCKSENPAVRQEANEAVASIGKRCLVGAWPDDSGKLHLKPNQPVPVKPFNSDRVKRLVSHMAEVAAYQCEPELSEALTSLLPDVTASAGPESLAGIVRTAEHWFRESPPRMGLLHVLAGVEFGRSDVSVSVKVEEFIRQINTATERQQSEAAYSNAILCLYAGGVMNHGTAPPDADSTPAQR